MKRFFEVVGPLFLAISGLIYGTGVLVSTTYFGRWNLTDLSGGELFRARYLQVGLFAIALPALWGSSLLSYFSLRARRGRDIAGAAKLDTRERQVIDQPNGSYLFRINRYLHAEAWDGIFRWICERPYWPDRFYFWGLVSWLNMFLILTLVAAMGRPAWFGDTQFVVSFVTLTAWTVLGSYLVAGFLDERRGVHKNLIRFFLFFVALYLDCMLFAACPELGEIIYEILFAHGSALALYIVLSFAILMMIHGGRRGARRTQDSRHALAIWAIVGISIIPLYYYAAIGFAFSIYPYIPKSKGGADYSTVARMRVNYNKVADDDLIVSEPLVPLEETANWMYFSDARDAEVKEWRIGYRQKRGIQIISRPKLLRIARDKIVETNDTD